MLKRFYTDRSDSWFLLITLLCISFPWSERINSVFILLLLAHWVFDRNLKEKVVSATKQWKRILPFWLFFFLHLLFLSKTIYWQDALQTIEVKLALLILPLLFATENHLNAARKNSLFMWFCYSCLLSGLYSLVACLIYYFPVVGWSAVFNRMYFSDHIMHPGYYSNFFVMAIIYLSLRFEKRSWHSLREKLIAFSLLLFFSAVLLILISKTAVIVLFLFYIFVLWRQLEAFTRPLIKYLIFGASTLVLLLLFTYVPSIKHRINETRRDLVRIDQNVSFGNSTGSRIAVWQLECELIRERWIQGYGTGSANPLLFNKMVQGNYTDLAANNMHTHNQVLHTWIDLGIAGVLCLLFLFASCFGAFYKSRNQLGKWTVILLFVYCLTDDALEIQSILVFCIFIICLLLFEKPAAEKLAGAAD